MNLTRCANGHYYDADRYKTCPHCTPYENDSDLSNVRKFEPFDNIWYFESLIGKGATGKVYKLADKSKKFFSAIKVINLKNSNVNFNYYEINDINRKLSLMYLMNGCDNIVEILNHKTYSNEESSNVLIQMELLTPITKYYQENNISEKDIIELGIGICTALEYCERMDIVHRDIKPENIFISPETGIYKLGDFGLAETVDRLYNSQSLKGTLTYIAPEVISNHEYSFQSDIYSLGLVLYQLMNNNMIPFQIKYNISAKEKRNYVSDRVKGARFLPPRNASKSFSKIIMKACSHNKDLRYKSASEMLKDLTSIEDYSEEILEYQHNNSEMIYLTEATHIAGIDETLEFSPEKIEFDFKHNNDNPDKTNDQKTILPTPKKNSKTISEKLKLRLVNWLGFTCVMSFIPIIIFILFRALFAPDFPYLEKCINDFIIFSMSISVISIRDIFSEKLWDKDKVISLLAVFINILILIFSTVTIGIITINSLNLLNIDINNDSLFIFSIILCIISFVSGTLIQVWEEL